MLFWGEGWFLLTPFIFTVWSPVMMWPDTSLGPTASGATDVRSSSVHEKTSASDADKPCP
jgi:hypothetical protein